MASIAGATKIGCWSIQLYIQLCSIVCDPTESFTSLTSKIEFYE